MCADFVKQENGQSYRPSGRGGTNEIAIGLGFEKLVTLADMIGSLAYATKVTLRVEGVALKKTYQTHTHQLSCSKENGGGHYKIDPTEGGVVESNEI